MPGDRAQAGERHVVGVNAEVLIGRTVQQSAAVRTARTVS